MNRISIVVPVFNEEGNVVALHKEIVDVCRENNYIFEIILWTTGLRTKLWKSANRYGR